MNSKINSELSLFNVLQYGGVFWKKLPNSPGYSFWLQSGTNLAIKVEGPRSAVLVHGACSENQYWVNEGKYAGRAFPSANAAVNAVREPSTNAYLYMAFQIEGNWVEANDLRYMEQCACDPVEEIAFEIAEDRLRELVSRNGRHLRELAPPKFAELILKLIERDPSILLTAHIRQLFASEPLEIEL